MDIQIATEVDIPELCQLLETLFTQEEEFLPDARAQAKGLKAIIRSEHLGDILVVRHKGLLVAMINLLYTHSTALGEPVVLLEDMVVADDYRGQGVGSLLLDYAVHFAEDRGCKRVTLLADADNNEARHLYHKLGFEQSQMQVYRKILNRD